jgi:hypothetical protein
MYMTMGNTNPVKYATAFTMRTDQEFLDLLDELRVRERPVLTRAEMLRKLVTEAAAKVGVTIQKRKGKAA